MAKSLFKVVWNDLDVSFVYAEDIAAAKELLKEEVIDECTNIEAVETDAIIHFSHNSAEYEEDDIEGWGFMANDFLVEALGVNVESIIMKPDDPDATLN